MELPDAPTRDLLDSAPDAMVIVDESGNVVLVNTQTEFLFGYDREELLGQPVEMLLPLRFRDAHQQHRINYLEKPKVRPMGAGLQLHGLRKDASEFPVEISLSPVATAAGTLVSSAIRDISERKTMEAKLIAARCEAERANSAKSEFLAAASHNLRQPLQTLELLGGVLERTVDNASAATALAGQRKALTGMSNLLNTLLDISKLESGSITPDINDCSVQAIFERLRAGFEAQALNKGIRLEVQDCEEVVRTDPGLLEQLIQNLLANAIRYTMEGRVLLRCLHLQSSVRIEVADTGIGISPSETDTIFEEFYQVEGANGKQREGFGLGLAIVQRLSGLLGLRVEVDSTPGEGSCFAITLPYGKQTVATPIEAQTTTPKATQAGGAIALIIDDDPAVVDATQLLLELEGYSVLVAPTLQAAMQLVNAAEAMPAIVIADFHLSGGVTGIDAIHAVREAIQRDIPAVLVTGDTSSLVMEALEQVGACKLLSKPVHSEDLLELMAQLIARSASIP